jgi:hypothetical protein
LEKREGEQGIQKKYWVELSGRLKSEPVDILISVCPLLY